MTNKAPRTAPTLDRAFDLYEAGDPNGAAEACEAILAAEPQNYGALYLLGSIFGERKRLDAAIELFERAIALKPEKPVAHYNLASALDLAGRQGEALTAVDAFLALKPEEVDAHLLRAAILGKLRRYEAALASAERALALKPGLPRAQNLLGNALAGLRRFDEAVACYDQAIARKFDFADPYFNRANALRTLRRYDEALAGYKQAIALKPDFGEAYANQANVLTTRKQYEAALASYRKARELDPGAEMLEGVIANTRRQICDWSDYAEECAALARAVEAGRLVAEPFHLAAVFDSNALKRRAAEIYVTAKTKGLEPPAPNARYAPRDKIRIGYFSADFHEHAVARVTAELFERHDKSRFETTAFAFRPDTGDAMRKRLVAAFDRFVDVADRSDAEVVALARSLEIDIAVDLMGFTEDARVEIFARRAAPIQINYLGFPGTMAAPFMDYIVADRTLIPAQSRGDFAEKIVYLPGSYQPNDRQRRIAEPGPTRAECGLPDGAFVFCCFNNLFKITPETFDGWMRILKRAPNAVLWLVEDNPAAVVNLRREAGARRVEPDRLVFAARVPPDVYLARYRLADLFLDTQPYNAHATGSDALWAGLPTLTRLGSSFAGRVGASLLTAAGLPEMIVGDEAEYEARAVEFAASPEKLAAIKAKLARNRTTTPLFDAERFARGLESAFRTMYERHHAGLAPDHIEVEA